MMTKPDPRGLALRTRYFELAASADENERATLMAELDTYTCEPRVALRGLDLSPVPSRDFCQLRFVAVDTIEARDRPHFVCPLHSQPELAAVFVDPRQLSFHTFENIVGLDHLFTDIDNEGVRLSQRRKLRQFGHRFNVEVCAELREQLAALTELELYAAPLNAASRGGQRFIFHAEGLATALTRALRARLPKRALTNFAHVNPVFRCNRFEPGDARFAPHVDAPYFDPARGHVSKYTLLLYLSGGRGEATLRLGEALAFDGIEAMSAFVFDQRLVHEGGPYATGPKLFLRTELIYAEPELARVPEVGALFAKACYLSAESLVSPALSRLADQAHDRASAAHWQRPEASEQVREPFIHKRFRGLSYLSNGYDFWFAQREGGRIECAVIALLDALNAKIGETPFRQQCETTLLVREFGEGDWIRALLRGSEPEEAVVGRIDWDTVFPELDPPDPNMRFPSPPEFGGEPYPRNWNAGRNKRVHELYRRTQLYIRQRVFGAPISMIGKQIFMDPARFVVEHDRIHVLSSERLSPVHFAGAAFFQDEDFLAVEVKIDTWQPLVPPIFFREHEGIVHLRLDLFRNDWMIDARSERVHVPCLIEESQPYAAPWLRSHEGEARARVEAELGMTTHD